MNKFMIDDLVIQISSQPLYVCQTSYHINFNAETEEKICALNCPSVDLLCMLYLCRMVLLL